MRKGAGTDRAVVLHTALEENAVAADQGAEENPTGLNDRGQKVERGDRAQDLDNVLTVGVVKDPVTGGLIVGLVKESGVKAERKKKAKRKGKAKRRRSVARSWGMLETSKLD